MLREEGRHVLPEPIARVAREEEFPHAGVDEAVARRALEEARHGMLHLLVLLRVLPRVRSVVLEAADAEEPGPELAGREAEVVAPQQLEPHGGGALVLTLAVAVHAFAQVRLAFFEIDEGFVDLSRGDAAESEPGGEFGAEVEAEHAVTGVFVGGHVTACDEVFDSVVASGLAAMERMGGLGFGWPFGWIADA